MINTLNKVQKIHVILSKSEKNIVGFTMMVCEEI